jgi:hypothetical protein
VVPGYAVGAYLLFLFVVVLERTRSVADTALFSAILQPSSIATTFALLAIFFFVRQRYLASGLALAAAGFFHSNFLVLGFPFFGLAHLLLGREELVRRLLQQHAPALAILVFQAPLLLQLATAENAAFGREIFLTIRSPHHYVPLSFLGAFVPFIGWHALALATVRHLGTDRPAIAVKSLLASFVALVLAATAATTVIYVPFIAQLFFWRMAPFSVMLAQIVLVTAVFRMSAITNPAQRRAKAWELALATAGLALVYFGRFDGGRPGGLQLFLLAYVALLVFIAYWPAIAGALKPGQAIHLPFRIPAFVLLAAFVINYGGQTIRNSNLIGHLMPTQEEKELFAWVKTTSPGARFAVPPDMQSFRLQGERAIIVDWKATPIDAAGMVEWHTRLSDISGIPGVRSLEMASAGYSEMTNGRIEFLRTTYDIQYLVFHAAGAPERLSHAAVFANAAFVAYRVGVESSGSGS